MIPANTLEGCEKSWPPPQLIRIAKSVKRDSNFLAWLPLLILPSVPFAFRAFLPPWVSMWALAISIYFGLKWLTLCRVQNSIHRSSWRSAAYLLAWPGMDAESFLDETNRPPMPRFREWFWAIFKTALGAFLLWIVAATLPAALLLLRGWVGMLGLILLLHFGTFQMLSLFWQSFGVQAQPIMMAPLRSQSLSEFWGKRWNLGFRQLAHELIFLPSGKYLPVGVAGLLVFFVSGLLHDAVISVPAQAGYGLPTGYFLLQGLGVIAERSSFGKQLGLGRGTRGWLFMALVAAGPVFWLFHSAFVTRVFIPFMEAIHAV